ncbi:threonine dehydratase [Micropruina sp.]|uniref:threonine dehydratase n=1 Tax=Micropruina sp. TaxID=2737536 RepID=UPI00261E59F8|nr:threonine dehydratase [Micropruina sp.]
MLTTEDLADATRIVAERVPVTPAYRWPLLERITGTPTWVKHENATPTGAFKVRGGLVFAERLRREGAATAGLIAATRGNHGQSVAYAARELGLSATIVVPEGNSPAKNASMAAFGAELVVHGRDFQESLEHARVLAAERGLIFVPSFHPDLVAGVATGAAELHAQAGRLDVIYVPVGLGSGICAHMAVRDLLQADTEIVGVVADRAPAHALSFEAGHAVSTPDADTFVDGVATRTPVPDAVAAMVAGAARFVRVSEADAEEAMRIIWQTTHQMPEPAGAISLAGLLGDTARRPGATAAVIMSGGNCDTDLVLQVLAS